MAKKLRHTYLLSSDEDDEDEENMLPWYEDEINEEEVIREIIIRDLIEMNLNEYFSNFTLEKEGYYWDFPNNYEGVGKDAHYNVECILDMPRHITKENVEIPQGTDSKYWRRIKGGPEEFLEGGYLSVKKVLEFMCLQLSDAIDLYGSRADHYEIQPFNFQEDTAVQAIYVQDPKDEEIIVTLVFSVSFRSTKHGYLDMEESFDLLAVPYDPNNINRNTDLWLVSKYRLKKEQELQREREISNTDSDGTLQECLEQVERRYLSLGIVQSSQRKEKGLVQKLVVEQIIRLKLSDIFDDVIFAGGSYEMTGIPGIADYDLECCLKMPEEITERNVEKCGRKGWRKIRGGPAKYLEGGYMSVQKVREYVYSELKRVIQSTPKNRRHKLELKEFDKGSASIKMIIIDSSKKHIDVDLVLSVKIKHDAENNSGQSYELIAKAFSRANPDDYPECWRISASKHEVVLFEDDRDRAQNEGYAKKWFIYQIMKLAKKAEENRVLDILPSYFYKQAYILLLEDFLDRPLHERFKEYIYYLVKALEEHVLIENMIPDGPNLLDRWTPEEVKPVKDFLRNITKDGDYFKLLVPVLKDDFKLQ